MIPSSSRGLLVAAGLAVVPGGAAAQPAIPQAPAQQQDGGQESKRLGRPFPTPFQTSQGSQPSGAPRPRAAPHSRPPQRPEAVQQPQRLGRPLPAPAPPPPRKDPEVSVSIVSP